MNMDDNHSDLLSRMHAQFNMFCCALLAQPGCTEAPAPQQPPHGDNLAWQNRLFESPHFSRAHVEILEIKDYFAVMHSCVLPRVCSPYPIFGFDMIAGRTQATGVFLDFSPVTPERPVPSLGDAIPSAQRGLFTQLRARPEWGSIFSADFFAIRPACTTEVDAALALAAKAFAAYLCGAVRPVSTPTHEFSALSVRAYHTAYARAQRQNPHTFRMLSRFVGADAARAFIDDVLFPMDA